MTSRLETDRRDFLKLAGFSLTALAVPACSRAPRHEAVPFLDKPEEVTPGRSTWYATLCGGCSAGCGLLARYRDGRPIKLEGNPEHPLNQGTTCVVGQAHLLSLYDDKRLRAPVIAGKPATWAAVDERVKAALSATREAGQLVRVLTGTVNGPTLTASLQRFTGAVPSGGHVAYDAVSSSALLDAHEALFGQRILPRLRFERAAVVVSFDADFLGTWISPVEYTRGWRERRSLEEDGARFSHHVQLESRLSLTGCSADERHALPPAEREAALAALAAEVAQRAGVKAPRPAGPVPRLPAELPATLADRLWEAPRGETLVVCGSNRPVEQKLTAWINHTLGNYGRPDRPGALDLTAHSRQALGDDAALATLLTQLESGRVGLLVVSGCNPLYDLPDAARWKAALEKVPLVVSTAALADETTTVAQVIAPDHHPLEAWADAEPVNGLVTVAQPTIRALGDTRGFAESLGKWRGGALSGYDLIRSVWRAQVHDRQLGSDGFDAFWSRAVHDGFVRVAPSDSASPVALRATDMTSSSEAVVGPADAYALVLYPKVALADGRNAQNPWLQELPDPVSKVSWDNYAVIAPEAARALGVETGDVIELATSDTTVAVPALVQPGQPERVVALALGYGRAGTDRFAGIGPEWIEARPTVEPGGLVGVRGESLVLQEGAYRLLDGIFVRLRPTGATKQLALSQLYDSLLEPEHLRRKGDGPRPIAQETTLTAWRRDPTAGAPHAHPFEPLYDDDHPYEGHHWKMAVDLSRCTGCSACVVACQAENNIPVVGLDEMRRQRGMHWMRIDRYFDGEGQGASAIHQPMLCQQCDNAPCESVCPVLATVHSSEGINQQVYNRCVGTRYCSNNCPYKVRRFNWFEYAHDSELQNLNLNPDVTVRSRGVMEKCNFCVQRIQEAKAQARLEGRTLADHEAVPACMQVCPAGAIEFGDGNDVESRVAAQMNDPRSYRVLEDLDVDPSVHYLRRVRDSREEQDHG